MATTKWRFDDLDPGKAWFEEDVRRFLPAVSAAVERALIEILDAPLANPSAVVRGEMVYIKRIHAALVETGVMPALLLAYTVSMRDHLIRRLALCRAADVAPDGALSTDEAMYLALERIVAAAMRRIRQSH